MPPVSGRLATPPGTNDEPGPEPAPPVFVDFSGRRRRRVQRLGRLLVVPAAGYLALVVSALLGGPTLGVPFLPDPPGAHQPHHPPAVADPDAPGPAAPVLPGRGRATDRSAGPSGGATPEAGPGPSAGPVAPLATASAFPTGAPTATGKVRGKSSAAPGRSRKPTARPSHPPHPSHPVRPAQR
ncbi:hypothetical protein [Streptomyces sp. NPDC089919]|uniref:hypothetical protein n=1 Tax=Streptomyces sp. NPDC089919 TaxID=3155188 RepID=UPI0034256D3C